tara:strand:- start:3358 stop:3624 length:267 start_codon:yes stop_codon:yes gene_type:complete
MKNEKKQEQFIKEIVYIPTQEIIELSRGTFNKLSITLSSPISKFKSGGYLSMVSRLDKLVVGIYLQYIDVLGESATKQFIRNNFAVKK